MGHWRKITQKEKIKKKKKKGVQSDKLAAITIYWEIPSFNEFIYGKCEGFQKDGMRNAAGNMGEVVIL